MKSSTLTDREKTVLQAVIEAYVQSAEPAGSRRLVQSHDLGVSAATVRNTMADLERKGFLAHPHTSAGRLPTDLAYRFYVDQLMTRGSVSSSRRAHIERVLVGDESLTELEALVQRAAWALGLLTGELGLSIGPTIASAILRKLDLVAIDSTKALLVLSLDSGVVRTVYVDLPTSLPKRALEAVSRVLNERLAGITLEEIHQTLVDRLRDVALKDKSAEALVNIFLESGPDIFAWATRDSDVHLGSASVLAEQPEFHSEERLKALMALTERRDLLASVLGERMGTDGPRITIGSEHGAPELADLTIITATYSVDSLHGVVGVIGPTRMPYEKVVALVDCTSSLVSNLVSH
jgi:heat-inducible transcriptional repressor